LSAFKPVFFELFQNAQKEIRGENPFLTKSISASEFTNFVNFGIL